MLRRRRTHQFKRNTRNTNPNRRRIMLKNIHKKILLRRRIYSLLQLAADAKTAQS
ncbi:MULTISPECIES: hypothetical protein [Pseudoalteromonas]|uniref:Uncharacterized protein n=1 Tax=Pseudoalteromonas obscura TaxID=3048491 RepID=A0ABT7EU16_9GAMM|nr:MULTISPECIES: hypothetical protein [Pseudoalteromonas]MBQ4839120.1 hypothetical protein [Pseudoalteromonas luteoviolacea]MDK2598556.1 hypothetical protein [Pseudoalteromonas sp. P94(2023)]